MVTIIYTKYCIKEISNEDQHKLSGENPLSDETEVMPKMGVIQQAKITNSLIYHNLPSGIT